MGDTNQSTRHPIQEDLHPLQYLCEILKSHNWVGGAIFRKCKLGYSWVAVRIERTDLIVQW